MVPVFCLLHRMEQDPVSSAAHWNHPLFSKMAGLGAKLPELDVGSNVVNFQKEHNLEPGAGYLLSAFLRVFRHR